MNSIQDEIAAWQDREFRSDGSPPNPLEDALIMAEEAGEVARCVLKRSQGVRGTAEHWTEELKKEIGDVVITAYALCAHEGFDLEEVVKSRWEVVGDGGQGRVGGVEADDHEVGGCLGLLCTACTYALYLDQ